MKKLFGGLNSTWPKLIISAVILGIYTGIMAMAPFAKDTSLADISIYFDRWVLFGILIIILVLTTRIVRSECLLHGVDNGQMRNAH